MPETSSTENAAEISPSSVVSRNPEMIFTDLDDTVVMMDPDEGRYYELDPVGSRIWALLETARPVAQVCDRLVDEYD